MPIQPPTYRLVSWPMRFVVLVLALGAAWMMLETWAAGVRLAKMMSAIGERNAAAEVAAARARQKQAPTEGGDPGVVYLQQPALPPAEAKAAPPRP